MRQAALRSACTLAERRFGHSGKSCGFIGFPGEPFPHILQSTAQGQKGIANVKSYWTLSRLQVTAGDYAVQVKGNAIEQYEDPARPVSEYVRMTGLDCIGCNVSDQGTGIITVQRPQGDPDGTTTGGTNAIKVLGCYLHGARSNNQQDHTVYFGGAAYYDPHEVAYCYMRDNVFDYGPEISINYQLDRIANNMRSMGERIHHNYIDIRNDSDPSSAMTSNAINIFNTGDHRLAQGTATQKAEPSYVYNNIVVGRSGAPTTAQQNGSALKQGGDAMNCHWYNNTVLDGPDAGCFAIGNVREDAWESHVYGNVFVSSDPTYTYVHVGTVSAAAATFASGDNIYYNGLAGTEYPSDQADPYSADPKYLYDPEHPNPTFTVDAGEPHSGTQPARWVIWPGARL